VAGIHGDGIGAGLTLAHRPRASMHNEVVDHLLPSGRLPVIARSPAALVSVKGAHPGRRRPVEGRGVVSGISSNIQTYMYEANPAGDLLAPGAAR
jgi:hypothetical protein